MYILQHRIQFLRMNRLRKVAVHPRLFAPFLIALERMCCERHNRLVHPRAFFLLRINLVASSPSMTGICTSMNTRSKAVAAPAVSMASWPFVATVTRWPRFSSSRVAKCWLTSLSSASNTCKLAFLSSAAAILDGRLSLGPRVRLSSIQRAGNGIAKLDSGVPAWSGKLRDRVPGNAPRLRGAPRNSS